ncbi:MAG: 4Fe-4S binding protein, partial [Oscillospiraceae bacterium]|nr:4Fe-4S binding protein [Oscillospiraceae bacterium]
YSVLARHASDCIECGSCETRCPFGVAIRENMREAVRIFGF